MLTHPTLDQLNQLGLFGMAKAFGEIETSGEAAALTHPEWLGLLLDREMVYRYDKKLAARLRYARLRQQAAVEDVDYRATRGLDRTLFQKLFGELALARGDGRYARLTRALGGVQLLILDDWGLEPLDAQARHDLLEILEERYGRRSTIITSQLPVDSWHQVIGDPTYADAILDRLVHNAQRLNLSGDSLRRTRAKAPQKS